MTASAPALGPIPAVAVLAGLVPLVLVLTAFTRIAIVLGFLRQGLGAAGLVPAPVMFVLALGLTWVSMQPLVREIEPAIPHLTGAAGPEWMAFLRAAEGPMRRHLLLVTRTSDLALIAGLSGLPRPEHPSDLPILVLACGYLLSELRVAFQIGIVVLLPFLLVDLVVASVAASFALPGFPSAALALLLKVYLFVSVDGWSLLAGALLKSLHP